MEERKYLKWYNKVEVSPNDDILFFLSKTIKAPVLDFEREATATQVSSMRSAVS